MYSLLFRSLIFVIVFVIETNTLKQNESELLFKIKQLVEFKDDILSENSLEYSGEFPFPPRFPEDIYFEEEFELNSNTSKFSSNGTLEKFGSGEEPEEVNSTHELELIASESIVKLLLKDNVTLIRWNTSREAVSKNVSKEENSTFNTFNYDSNFDEVLIGDVQNSTREPILIFVQSNRTKNVRSTTVAPDSTTIDLAQLKLCPNTTEDEKVNLTCQWETARGKQLKVWPDNSQVSMCTALTLKLNQCQSLCEKHAECQSIHYCSPCVKYNCRLLKDKKNSASKLDLIDAYFYVDYHEKVKC